MAKEIVVTLANGDKAGETLKQLTHQAAALKKEISGLKPGTEDFVKSSASLNQVKDRMSDINKQVIGVEKSSNGLNSTFKNMIVSVTAAFSIGKLIEFGRAVFNITAEFQKFQSVLTNTLGSRSEALKTMVEITKFASVTPFSVRELTESFVKLANQGFKPTMEEMRKLGDLAAANGKTFDQLTEAIIDGQTGEFERLKEFGIRASKAGDQVTFTFKGVKTQTDFTAASIREYILSLGDLQGVTGGMAAISATLGGKLSNVGDNIDALLKTIGDSSGGLLGGILDLINMGLGGLNNALNDQVGKLQEEQTELNVLVGAITDVNTSTDARSQLITQLNQKYPDFLKNLDAEKVTNDQLRSRMADVNEQFIKKIGLVRAQERLGEIQDKILDQIDREAREQKRLQELKAVGDKNATNSGLGLGTANMKIEQTEYAIKTAQAERIKLQDQLTERVKNYTEALGLFNKSNKDYFESPQRKIDEVTNPSKKGKQEKEKKKGPTSAEVEAAQAAEMKALERANDLEQETKFQKALVALDADTKAKIKASSDAKFNEDVTRKQQEIEWEKLSAEVKLENINMALTTSANAFGALAGLQEQGSEDWKAFATAQATISAIQGALNAYTSTASILPYGPILAPIAAAAALAAGYANVSRIQSTPLPKAKNKGTSDGQFYSGGYTGDGSKYEVAGTVHAGEVVWSQADVARFGGVRAVEAIRPTSRMNGYYNGGPVSPFKNNTGRSPIPSGNAGGGSGNAMFDYDQMAAAFDRRMDNKIRLIKVQNVVTETQDAMNVVNSIRDEANV
jgi:hypothetical protein